MPSRRSLRRGAGPLFAVLVLAAVVVGLVLGSRPTTPADPAPTVAPSVPAPPATDPPELPLAGVHLVLDPGHNGGNAETGAIHELVEDGRGGRKACNTVGTATAAGYPEHAFTFDVAERAAALLRADGATVTLTRTTDDGVGPCVDARGRSAQEAGADALVSLHADGAADTGLRGYFAIVSDPPLNPAQGEPSRELAAALLTALGAAGFSPSGAYPGALSERADLATLNFAERPVVMLELAEMRNPEDAAVAESPEGRARYAEAVAAGIRTWAAQRPR